MSVVALPRRPEADLKVPRRAPSHRPATKRPSLIQRWSTRSHIVRVSLVLGVAVGVVLLGNAYATERQVEIHQMQTEILQAQSRYAAEVAALTNSTAPAKIASGAGALHLVVPTSVSQISTVSLTTPLALPTLTVRYTPTSRIYR